MLHRVILVSSPVRATLLHQHLTGLAWHRPPGSQVRAGHAPKLCGPQSPGSPCQSHERRPGYEAATSSTCLGLASLGTFSVEERKRCLLSREDPRGRNIQRRGEAARGQVPG